MSLVSNPKYKAAKVSTNIRDAYSKGNKYRLVGSGPVDIKGLYEDNDLSSLGISFKDIMNAAKYNPDYIDSLVERFNYANMGAFIRPKSDITRREMQEIDAARAKNFDAITTPNPNYTEEEYNSLNMPAGQELLPFSVDHPMHPKNTFITLSNAKKSNRKEYQEILDSVLEAYGGFEPYRDALSAYAKTEEGSNFLKMPSSDVQNMPYTVDQNKDTSAAANDDVQNMPDIRDPDRNPNNEDTVKLFSTQETGSSETDSLEDTQEKPVDYEGSFPIYKVDSKKAQSFRDTFSAAEEGAIFEWDGRKYRKDYA